MKTNISFYLQIGFLISYEHYKNINMTYLSIHIPFFVIEIEFKKNYLKLFYEWLQELGKNCPKETKW